MNHRLTSLLTVLLLLTACTTASLPAPTETAAPTKKPSATPRPPTATPRPTVTRAPTASPTPKSNRSASFTVVEKTVEARKSEKDAYSPASEGLALPVGGQARTGEDGRARLDLAPDGTIVRMVPNTVFTLASLEEKEKSPFTTIKLFFGQIFIILQGGSLEVETPSGVAAVSGSMMSVSYNPDEGVMTATCLEGHCSLRNDAGKIELVAGQAADIQNGALSDEPRPITDQELQNWLDYTPEVEGMLDRLPGLRDRIDKLLGEKDRRKPPFLP